MMPRPTALVFLCEALDILDFLCVGVRMPENLYRPEPTQAVRA